jgi:hypothetical protein
VLKHFRFPKYLKYLRSNKEVVRRACSCVCVLFFKNHKTFSSLRSPLKVALLRKPALKNQGQDQDPFQGKDLLKLIA